MTISSWKESYQLLTILDINKASDYAVIAYHCYATAIYGIGQQD